MKKFIMMLTLIMGLAVSAMAQTALVDNGTVNDNWYFGANVGTNVWNDVNSWTIANTNPKVNDGVTNSWWRTFPISVSVMGGKMFNPYVGAEVAYTGVFNLRGQNPFLDGHNLTGNVVINLSNAIAGYNGKRRVIEGEFIGGAGWLHNYIDHLGDGSNVDMDGMSVVAGLRGNVNLTQNLAITVTPEYMWIPKNIGGIATSKQGFNVSVGFKYRINSKRGNFPLCKLYDQDEVNRLTSDVNSLKASNEELIKSNADLSETIKRLTEDKGKIAVKTIINFEQGKSDVDSVEIVKIANSLKGNNASVILTGTTSPEGGEILNRELGISRAIAVKSALVEAGIDENRIAIRNSYDNQRMVIITVE